MAERRPAGPPPAVVASAKAVFARRGTKPVVALVADSLVDGSGTASSHVLEFRHPFLSLDLHVSKRGRTYDLRGVVASAGLRWVVLQRETETRFSIAAVVGGRFEFRRVPSGLFRLSLPTQGDPVPTDWFRL